VARLQATVTWHLITNRQAVASSGWKRATTRQSGWRHRRHTCRRGKSLIFNGHVDVVQPGDARSWSDGNPFSGRIDGGRVYGRGACDEKGGVIGQALAAVALRRAGVVLKGDLILESVVGEEVMDHDAGADAVTRAGFRADAAIVSQPTAPPVTLAVVPITPGLLCLGPNVIGKAVHSSVRDEQIRAGGQGAAVGVNAIEKGVYLLNMIQRVEEEWGQSGSPAVQALGISRSTRA
jgi:acetylornithine deacetylase/succinyl-diaminopimelate desuccinylase-like protein